MSESYVSLAKQFQADPSLVPTDRLPDLHRFDYELANPYRKEFYALMAVVASEVVEDAVAKRPDHPPYGLVNSAGDVTSFNSSINELGFNLKTTLDLANMATQHRMRRSESAPIVRRLGELVNLFNQVEPRDRYTSTANLVLSGLKNGVNQSVSGLSAISRLVLESRPEASTEEVVAIARRSGILLRKVASININHLPHFTSLIASIGSGREDRESRPIGLKVNDEGKEFVDFVARLMDIGDPKEQGATVGELVPIYFRTIGCPAMAKLNGVPSPINRIWHWTIDAAEQAALVPDPVFDTPLKPLQVA